MEKNIREYIQEKDCKNPFLLMRKFRITLEFAQKMLYHHEVKSETTGWEID